jgi:hypothetical protein
MMRKILAIFIAIMPFISNCSKENTPELDEQIRKIAWNSLSSPEKSTVTTAWHCAKVESATYNNRNVYAVMFNTTNDALLGPITVYVEVSTKHVLGQALRF